MNSELRDECKALEKEAEREIRDAREFHNGVFKYARSRRLGREFQPAVAKPVSTVASFARAVSQAYVVEAVASAAAAAAAVATVATIVQATDSVDPALLICSLLVNKAWDEVWDQVVSSVINMKNVVHIL